VQAGRQSAQISNVRSSGAASASGSVLSSNRRSSAPSSSVFTVSSAGASTARTGTTVASYRETVLNRNTMAMVQEEDDVEYDDEDNSHLDGIVVDGEGYYIPISEEHQEQMVDYGSSSFQREEQEAEGSFVDEGVAINDSLEQEQILRESQRQRQQSLVIARQSASVAGRTTESGSRGLAIVHRVIAPVRGAAAGKSKSVYVASGSTTNTNDVPMKTRQTMAARKASIIEAASGIGIGSGSYSSAERDTAAINIKSKIKRQGGMTVVVPNTARGSYMTPTLASTRKVRASAYAVVGGGGPTGTGM